MKKYLMLLAALATVFCLPLKAAKTDYDVSGLALNGFIEGENITFDLSFTVDVHSRNAEIPLVIGDVALYEQSDLPRGSELVRENNVFMLKKVPRGDHDIVFKFASRPLKEGEWRQTNFNIPMANIRKLAVVADRNDLEVRFADALKTERSVIDENKAESTNPHAGKTLVTAFLGLSSKFDVRWKPKVTQLAAELVVATDANTIATASVGALRLDTVFQYRVIQGRMSSMEFDVPASMNITQVKGNDIQDWSILKKDDKRVLTVTLSRPLETSYQLQIISESILQEFPSDVDVPVLIPRNVIRASGFVMFGTDSAIKLMVNKAGGLTQVDQTAFPAVLMDPKVTSAKRTAPSRSTFVYQYANTPYSLQLKADDIVSEYTADERLILRLQDNDLEFNASVELDVRDAPASELVFITDKEWTVANVSGPAYSDHDVREENGKKYIKVFFKKAVLGRTLLDIRLENSLADGQSEFKTPSFSIKGAKSERGYFVAATEKGLRLKNAGTDGLREVHTGSVPMRVKGVQLAWRYKQPGWTATIGIEKTSSVIHSELFHLVSIGDGVLYGSSRINYLIRGAPVSSFTLKIPETLDNVELIGHGIADWKKEGDTWIINLQEKVSIDYTLLVTYDQPYQYEGGNIEIGSLGTVHTASEVGYVALSSEASLKLTMDTASSDKSVFQIDPEEIPAAYVQPVLNPILAAYKYTQSPHVANVTVTRYSTAQLISQIVDRTSIQTSVSREGEVLTRVLFFVKNTSHQYLSVALPEGARLWTTKLADESEVLQKVFSLEGPNGEILVPIRRPRNPDSFMMVEVVYSESFEEVPTFGSQFALSAPITPNTDSSFAEWTVNVPKEFAVASPGGNMTTDFAEPESGMAAAWQMLKRLAVASLRFVAMLIPLAVLVFFIALGQYARGCGRGMPLVVVAGILGVVLSIFGAVNLHETIAHTFPGVTQLVDEPIRDISFSRNVSLARGQALTVSFRIVPEWMGSGASVVWTIGPIVVGLIILMGALRRKEKQPMLLAIGLTALLAGISNLSGGRMIVMAVVSLIGVLIIIRLLLKILHALRVAGERHAARRLAFAGTAQATVDDREVSDLHPFDPTDGETVNRRVAPDKIPDVSEDDQEDAPQEDEHTTNEPDGSGEDIDDDEAEEDDMTDASDETNDEKRDDEQDDDSRRGSASPFLLFIAALLGVTLLAAAPSMARSVAPPPAPEQLGPTMDILSFKVLGPSSERGAEKSAEIVKCFSFTVDDEASFPVLSAQDVLTSYDLGSRYLSLESGTEGYTLKVERKGTYTVKLNYLSEVSEKDGVWYMVLPMQPNLRNKVELTLPEPGLEIASHEAVLFKSKSDKKQTTASAVFGPTKMVSFSWRPAVRKTHTEKSVYYCDINTYAAFKPGVVDLTSLVRYQIAQGEVKSMKFSIPAGMNVTAVKAPGLSTWRFDPDTNELEAVLSKGVSGSLNMLVVMQMPTDGLPYNAKLGSLDVEGAARQRGSLALAVPDTVQISTGKQQGLNTMNVEDFSRQADLAAKGTLIKRAFRYHSLPVSLEVGAEAVLPEIRVKETGSVSISDERVILSTILDVEVTKTGIFSLELLIPKDYDVESLSGDAISHWDDAGEDGKVMVHFNNQALGHRSIALSIARIEKGIEETISVPHVGVTGARKHTGSMIISGEKGVRMTVNDAETTGVSRMSAEKLSIRQPGALAFDLLRPNWAITLNAEVMSPSVKPEILHRIDIAEGILKGRGHILYTIENAGIKSFLVQSPQPGAALSFSGKNIAKVQEVDKEKGIWQVDLHSKQESQYSLKVTYQIPFGSETVNVRALSPIDTETPRGYLVVLSGGRVQVQQVGESEGLTPADSRAVPSEFGESELSDAIMCFRSVRPTYNLNLSVTRHGSADLLPATVQGLDLTSVVSEGGSMLTEARLELMVGNLRFLTMTMPGKKDKLWSVLINDKVVEPARDDKTGSYRIPLDDVSTSESTVVELIYAGRVPDGKYRYTGPDFGLPLANIEWTFYMTPGRRYYDFDGTMSYEKEACEEGVESYTVQSYIQDNRQRAQDSKDRFKTEMKEAEELRRDGNQMLANKKLANAKNWAYDQSAHEDARVQLRSHAREQYMIGTLERRGRLRESQNILDPLQSKLRYYNDGDYQVQWGNELLTNLDESERQVQSQQLDKILEQQESATDVKQAIRVTIPRHGQKLVFSRQMLNDDSTALEVSFKSAGVGGAGDKLIHFWPHLLTVLLIWGLLRGFNRRESDPVAA